MDCQSRVDLNTEIVSTDPQVNRWAKWIHWSLYAAYFIPLLGLAVPIMLWKLKRKQSTFIDEHGKIVVNWMMNLLLYVGMFVFGLYKFAGLFGCAILFVVSMLYPLIGGLKAKKGQIWEYPFLVRFYR